MTTQQSALRRAVAAGLTLARITEFEARSLLWLLADGEPEPVLPAAPTLAGPMGTLLDAARVGAEAAARTGVPVFRLDMDENQPRDGGLVLTMQGHPLPSGAQARALLAEMGAADEPAIKVAEGYSWFFTTARVGDVLVRVVCQDEPKPVAAAAELDQGSAGSPASASRAKDGHDATGTPEQDAPAAEPHLPAGPTLADRLCACPHHLGGGVLADDCDWHGPAPQPEDGAQ